VDSLFQGNKTSIGGNTESDEVSSDSQRASSGFHTNYSSVPSLSTDSMSPTTSLMSLREDADSGNSAKNYFMGVSFKKILCSPLRTELIRQCLKFLWCIATANIS
jgi:hypothetical protein